MQNYHGLLVCKTKIKFLKLNDQLKLLEDDQRNLVEISQIAQNQLQTEQDKLHQIIRHVESQVNIQIINSINV